MKSDSNIISPYIVLFALLLHTFNLYAQKSDTESDLIVTHTHENINSDGTPHVTIINLKNQDNVIELIDSILDAKNLSSENLQQRIRIQFDSDSSTDKMDSLISFFNNPDFPSLNKRKVALGVMIYENNESQNLKYDHPLISNVIPNSPAEKAGLKKSDVLYKLDHIIVSDLADIVDIIRKKSDGDTLSIFYIRNADTLYTEAQLRTIQKNNKWYSLLQKEVFDKENCKPKTSPFCKKIMIQKGGPKLGVQIRDLDAKARKALKAKKGGVLITKVIEHSAADKMGLQVHDVITSVNGTETLNATELKSLIESFSDSQPIKLKYIRYGKKKTAEGVLEEFSQTWDDNPNNIIDLSRLFKE